MTRAMMASAKFGRQWLEPLRPVSGISCSAECGRCARTIKTIIDEALGACAKACCSGCPHSQTGVEKPGHDVK
jgi:hypothetical protein